MTLSDAVVTAVGVVTLVVVGICFLVLIAAALEDWWDHE